MLKHSGVSAAVFALTLSAAFISCSRASAQSSRTLPAPNYESNSGASEQTQEQNKTNPDVEKFNAVYAKMSLRFKGDIHFEDESKIEAFIKDLKDVLAEEKEMPENDVSLFYLIDKKHNIGSEYEPKGLIPVKQCSLYNVSRNDLSLRPEAFYALDDLARAAKADGITLMVSSTYRSYNYQKNLFARYVAQDGEAEAERYSARPGTSQHQLGVAVDFGSITDDWGDTRMGKWVYNNAAKYGWSLSFPKGYEDVTGYMWECWHFRYIGKKACALQEKYFAGIQQYMLEFIDAWKN